MKILTVIGARPQFIKAATVSRALKESNIPEIIVHTGQHFDSNMSDIFFDEMVIPRPDHFLNISGLSHGAMTGQMTEKIEGVLKEEKPDFVLVYGDTNSTLAGALAAVKLHIPIAHVEAGLRSFNMRMPEEINRILTDRISTKLYCPTSTAIENLQREGFDNIACEILLTGDVMYDAALFYSERSGSYNTLEKYKLDNEGYFLATIHRAENTDSIENLEAIIGALNQLHEQHPVVLPLHPRTRKIIQDRKLPIAFQIIDPVGYFDMLNLIKGSRMVLTDSGGLQKEAYFFQKFCVTMRDQTEWVELVKGGFNILTGADKNKIQSAVQQFLTRKFDSKPDLYGNGNAAGVIVKNLIA
ncbi:MAG TPA: UDP-N-acetylglucosamine 2-epimerase (non-hydrolyzing) [Cyclobacteriaceae bacterium]|nr:UDP-N-acetylglucosamine 2-epimerase (non-hydrolyzing) [Cyclobacteriaceae bacterium]